MNYGRESARRRRRQLTSKATARRQKAKAIFLLCILLLVIGGVGFAGYQVYGYAQGVLDKTPDISSVNATPSGFMSTVLDEDGNVTAQLVGTGSNRVYVTLDEIPVDLQHAFVAIEDERFYEHNGIDLKGIIRAGVRGLSTGSFSQGASTITQQLLKNNVFDGWTSETRKERIERKIQEQYLAIELEKEVSKDWIMENYLNTINLGQNTLGVEAAANRYFGKTVSELSLSECAVIAAITQNPSRYNPITHPEENKERRQSVLLNMREQNYITKEEYDEAINDDVYSRVNAANEVFEQKTNVTSYFVDALTEEVIEDLQSELGYSKAQAYKALYSGGLTIYSTQDPDIQEICDDAVDNDGNYGIDKQVSFSYALSIQRDDGTIENYGDQTMLTYLRSSNPDASINYTSEQAAEEAISAYRNYLLESGGSVIGENITYTEQPQSSMTVIDQSSGQVKALVGGRGDKTASKTLNRAADTTRQPGSTFKIISTYAPALDADLITLATAMKDEEITYKNGKVVRNADGKYRGTTTIRTAIQNSINVIAIKTSREVTLETCFEAVRNFGITTLTDQDMVEALPLGGITDGVTNMELTAAYAAIANGGEYKEPTLYTKILDHDGNVLLEKTPETHRVIKETTAYLLTSAMQDVVKSGTGRKAQFSGMSIAGKTGTTSDTRDSWFAAFTPYYTCAVWEGYDDNSELESGADTRLIWKDAMSEIHADLEDTGFERPEGITTATVCSESGLLATSGLCTKTHTEYFADDTEPTKKCKAHEKAVICKTSGKLAGEYCPEEEKEEKSFVKNSENDKATVPTEKCDVHTAENTNTNTNTNTNPDANTNTNTETAPAAQE